MDKNVQSQIKYNIKSHDMYHKEYEEIHGAIFNPIEQKRIQQKLKYAIKNIKTNTNQKIALDYGCGSGNLTNHLIELGVHTTAADVSEKFLNMVEKKHKNTRLIKVLKVSGQSLSSIKNNTYDFVATYSVLHHVPDYLRIIEELVRVLKPGGIIYLDHEVNESYWNKNDEYIKFLELAEPKPQKDSKRFFRFTYYYNKIRRFMNPRFQEGGDIHVWPDDHIEWDKIEDILINQGCEIILIEDYLLFRKGYPTEIYEKYKNRCSDLRLLIARKNSLN